MFESSTAVPGLGPLAGALVGTVLGGLGMRRLRRSKRGSTRTPS
jgi:hypothetical protein